MPYSLTYDEDLRAVVVVLTGRVDLSAIREAARATARMCGERSCRRILNDASGADVHELKFLDVYASPEVLEECGIPRTTTRALVVPAGFADAQFLEDVTCIRGHTLRVFPFVEEARAWLRGRA
ncbi:MAG TPA: hypothetical protein PK636_08655 [bacterium]|nr:hypothetical protein [bacterium]HPJ72741.1 hypothetical protein [bacterium]HPQ67237.1 hypothetical protein [bacterium]